MTETENYAEYYKAQLEDAQKYQDWVTNYLLKHGIVLQVYSSKEYQYNYGETASHDEIKFDKEQENSGNLAIETHEKSHPDNPNYVESGILRQNIVRWIHGNKNNIWIFSARTLRGYISDGLNRLNDPLIQYQTKTSIGILLPCIEADRICEQKFRPYEKDLLRQVVINKQTVVPRYTESRKERGLFEFERGVA